MLQGNTAILNKVSGIPQYSMEEAIDHSGRQERL
jgi:hypothetical protein